MKYRVRQMDVGAPEQGLLELWRRNLMLEGDLQRRFRWYYRDNPAGEGVSFLLEHEQKELVGSAGLNLRSFSVGGEELSAGIMGDFNVDRRHRTLFPAFMMQRAVSGQIKKGLGFGYGFPNRVAEPVLLRAGCKKLALQSRYVRPLSAGEYVGRVVENPMAAVGISLGADLLLRGLDRARSAPCRVVHCLRWPTDVDARFDELWQRARGNYPIIGRRDADALRWRFVQKPDSGFEFAVTQRRTTGRLSAYAVVQRLDGVAHVRDLFSHNLLGLDNLLGLLIPALRRKDCSSISFSFLGNEQVIQLLRWHGFTYREDETDKLVVVHTARQEAATAAALLDPERWYLTEFDEDD